ncbi:MAG: hypothetical protein KAS90_06590 [Candidatus Aenigmarchaeota archaeon]|nr:hypothetical protein [Candidatus Aenigmarchaeota archaeon]
MSDACSSCDSGSCYTSGLPTTASPVSLGGPGLDYSSTSPASVYSDIRDAGGLDAAIDMYGIESLAKDIYLEHSSDPERIADILKNTDINGVYGLPPNVAGVNKSTIGYNPFTGEGIVDSDISYDNNLSPDDKLYTAIHELCHSEQLEYSKNMPVSFAEGDAEMYTDYIINDYVSKLEDLYEGSLNTSNASDPTYIECNALITDIYTIIGNGDAIEGRELFQNAEGQHGGDVYRTLDSFEKELAENGMDLKTVYNMLNDLDRELEAKNPYADTNPATPYDDMTPPGFDGLGPILPGFDSIGPIIPGYDGLGPAAPGLPYDSYGNDLMPGYMNIQVDPLSKNKIPDDELLHKAPQVLKGYINLISS